MTYDHQCHDLAQTFVDDSEIISSQSTRFRDEAIKRIAESIQNCIDGEIEELEQKARENDAEDYAIYMDSTTRAQRFTEHNYGV